MTSRKLRVAVLGFSANSYGGDSYFRSFLPALERYGSDLECVLLSQDDRYAPFCRPGGVVRLQRVPVPRFLRGPARSYWEQVRLPDIIRELAPDIVYTANSTALLACPRPCVIAVRNMDPLSAQDPRNPVTLKIRNMVLRRVVDMSARRSARVIAVSEFVRAALVRRGVPEGRIDLVYHGIDDLPPLDERAGAGRVPFVAAAAKFIRYANLETLIRGFAVLKGHGYAGELRLAGGSLDRRYEREIKALVRSRGLEASVRFLGYVTREAVHRLMRDCDAFLFSSTLEACPFTLLEAMRHGAAVVTTTAEPMPEFCGDAALYAAPRDWEQFGIQAYRLISDESLRVGLRRRAVSRALSFRWEESVRRLVSSWERAACMS